MSAWRRVAIEKIPRLRKLIAESDNVYCLWGELWSRFVRAHSDPIDEELIGPIYAYAWWCIGARAPHTSNAGVVCFFEDLPTNPKVREQMPKWLTAQEFSGLTELFRYHLRSDKEYQEFLREFYEPKEKLRRDETIYHELFRLGNAAPFQTASPEERQARWAALFVRAGGEQGINTMDPDLAAQLLGHGWTCAMAAADHPEALRLTDLFLQHPGWARADVLNRMVMLCNQATSLLYLNRAEEAAELCRCLFREVKDRPEHVRIVATLMWGHLNRYCTDQPGEKTASPVLAKLVHDVVSRLSRRVRRAASTREPSEGANCAELLVLLAATHENVWT